MPRTRPMDWNLIAILIDDRTIIPRAEWLKPISQTEISADLSKANLHQLWLV